MNVNLYQILCRLERSHVTNFVNFDNWLGTVYILNTCIATIFDIMLRSMAIFSKSNLPDDSTKKIHHFYAKDILCNHAHQFPAIFFDIFVSHFLPFFDVIFCFFFWIFLGQNRKRYHMIRGHWSYKLSKNVEKIWRIDVHLAIWYILWMSVSTVWLASHGLLNKCFIYRASQFILLLST